MTAERASERLLLAHLDEAKSAKANHVRWVESAAELRMKFSVELHGGTVMQVGGVFRGPGDQQIWLDLPGWRNGRVHLIRICCTPAHESVLHWHKFEGGGKLTRTNAYEGPELDLSEPSTLLVDVFAPKLKIFDYVYEGSLRP